MPAQARAAVRDVLGRAGRAVRGVALEAEQNPAAGGRAGLAAPAGGPPDRRTALRGARHRLLFHAGLRGCKGGVDRRAGERGSVIPWAVTGGSRTTRE